MGKKNVEYFIHGTIKYLNLIGFDFENNRGWKQIYFIIGLCNLSMMLVLQILFHIFAKADMLEKTAAISYMNYFLVSIGKVIALLYNRKAILNTLNEFRKMYPSKQLESEYNLQSYLKQYLLLEKIITGIFKVVTIFYNVFPFFLSLTEYLKNDKFTYETPLMLWYPVEIRGNYLFYALTYFQQVCSSFTVAIIILGSDLCLFNILLQFCLHFDIIQRNILKIEPNATDDAEKRLKQQIIYHQQILKLADKLNGIFTPSLLFSLLSSSLIICFTMYQLLGDITMLTVVKTFFLFCYEMKQVIITCFLGDKLIEISLKISEAIYEHKWYNGTPRYKRLVLFVLMRSQKSAALKIAGISDVSKQTLRKVMSISYQIFTVLKTGRTSS